MECLTTCPVDDLDNDGQAEIVVPSGVTTLCAYRPDGVQLDTIRDNKKWGEAAPGKV